MYNLDEIIKMYFYCVSVSRVLKGDTRVTYCEFPLLEFQRISKVYLTRYSDTENRELYRYVEGSVRSEGHPYAGIAGRSGLNVFAALEELAEQLLVMEDNKVLCQYTKLMRYREITRYLDEDAIICAFLAVRNKRFRENPVYFSWGQTIGHNNVQFNRMLERGISENHFHLYGSAPSFMLVWIYLMNHTADLSVKTFFSGLDERPRNSRNHYCSDYEEEPFEERVLKAALIRICLSTYLTAPGLFQAKGVITLEEAKRVLEGRARIQDVRVEIQNLIYLTKEWQILHGREEQQDYLMYQCAGSVTQSRNSPFAGERWFLYQILVRELQGAELGDMYQWFYAYLIIKNNLRAEIVQVNDTVGFENFSVYSKRWKGIYNNYRQMARCAVEGTLETGNVRSLEIRIAPGSSARQNARMIAELDQEIQDVVKAMDVNPHIYYVLHFRKTADDAIPEKNVYDGRSCRHERLRASLYREAEAVRRLRDCYPDMACRVLGIDACSQEIGCRPEVFAPVFRMLSCHVTQDIPNVNPKVKVGQLRLTYHVGEDFLDVVDGLRAVDEAVHFLNLKCGDRIGHGTVLGIDVPGWYRYKRNTILISKQDYLDNVVWLYQKLQELDIAGCENLKQYLRKQYDIYFPQIYGHLMEYDGNSYIWMRPDVRERIRNGAYHFGMNIYYEAWKLRGDEPKLYLEGIYQERTEHYLEEYLVNRQYPEDFRTREQDEINLLYYLYHYNWEVRSIGKEIDEIYIPDMYVAGVADVQRAFCKKFASYGIGVETNPSSNLLISTIQSYTEHTVPRFYNKNLTYDVQALEDCPQLSISVNTDDKGVFGTSLENEYALLACSMEKARDSAQNLMYHRQMIYQWLDDIREMGNLQSFR